MTIDSHGNHHHQAGSLVAGRFASKSNTPPPGALAGAATRSFDDVRAAAVSLGRIGSSSVPRGSDADYARTCLWWAIHFGQRDSLRTEDELRAGLTEIAEAPASAAAVRLRDASDHALRWVLGEVDEPVRSS